MHAFKMVKINTYLHLKKLSYLLMHVLKFKTIASFFPPHKISYCLTSNFYIIKNFFLFAGQKRNLTLVQVCLH